MSKHSANGAAYRRLRAEVIATEHVCWLCGHPVNRMLSGRHPDGPTADHPIPTSQGGLTIRSNLRLAHNRCNSARQDREPDRTLGQTSRRWT